MNDHTKREFLRRPCGCKTYFDTVTWLAVIALPCQEHRGVALESAETEEGSDE